MSGNIIICVHDSITEQGSVASIRPKLVPTFYLHAEGHTPKRNMDKAYSEKEF